MTVLILRQRGPTPLSDEVVAAVEKHPGLQILERSSKMLRVAGEGRHLEEVAGQHAGLEVSEEQSYRQVKPPRASAQGKSDESC